MQTQAFCSVDFMYSFVTLSIPGALPFFYCFKTFKISFSSLGLSKVSFQVTYYREFFSTFISLTIRSPSFVFLIVAKFVYCWNIIILGIWFQQFVKLL